MWRWWNRSKKCLRPKNVKIPHLMPTKIKWPCRSKTLNRYCKSTEQLKQPKSYNLRRPWGQMWTRCSSIWTRLNLDTPKSKPWSETKTTILLRSLNSRVFRPSKYKNYKTSVKEFPNSKNLILKLKLICKNIYLCRFLTRQAKFFKRVWLMRQPWRDLIVPK